MNRLEDRTAQWCSSPLLSLCFCTHIDRGQTHSHTHTCTMHRERHTHTVPQSAHHEHSRHTEQHPTKERHRQTVVSIEHTSQSSKKSMVRTDIDTGGPCAEHSRTQDIVLQASSCLHFLLEPQLAPYALYNALQGPQGSGQKGCFI